jgi:hypothetical protein
MMRMPRRSLCLLPRQLRCGLILMRACWVLAAVLGLAAAAPTVTPRFFALPDVSPKSNWAAGQVASYVASTGKIQPGPLKLAVPVVTANTGFTSVTPDASHATGARVTRVSFTGGASDQIWGDYLKVYNQGAASVVLAHEVHAWSNSASAVALVEGQAAFAACEGAGTVSVARGGLFGVIGNGASSGANVTDARGLDVSMGSATANTYTTARLLYIYPSILRGTTTTLRGIDMSGWSVTGSVGTSYGLYMDSSVDVGATKYAIFSGSTSLSSFAGRILTTQEFVSDAATKGVILKSPNAHYWRITVGDTGALSTADLGTTLP